VWAAWASLTSGLVWEYPDELLQTTWREAGVITRVQLLEAPPPQKKKWEGQKSVQISARFLTTFDFDREYLRNGSTYRTSEQTWSARPRGNWKVNLGDHVFFIFEMSIRSGDIRDQSRKLSKIEPKFGRLLPPPQLKKLVGAFQKLYRHYHHCLAARRLEKFHEDTPTSPEVIGA